MTRLLAPRSSPLARVVIVGMLLGGCAPGAATGLPGTPTIGTPTIGPSPSVPPASLPIGTPDALARARADLEHLLVELERIHPEPFHGIDRADWIAAKDDLAAALPTLSPEQALVELQRLVALLSRAGRDGHQFAFATQNAEGPILPIRVHEFEEGLFITASNDDESLVGARIDAVESRPIADVLAAIEPLVPRDGPSTVPLFRPLLLLRTSVLRGLGIADAGDVTITVRVIDGSHRDVELSPISLEAYRAWATDFGMIRLAPRPGLDYLDGLDSPIFSWRYLESSRSILVRYTQVRPVASSDLDPLLDRADDDDVDRVIVDLRQNPGGDNHSFPPILRVLDDPTIDRPGRLFVLTDRVTFSAASNFSTAIEQSTDAIFVGEPMGGGLNFWDDVRQVRLSSWPIPMQVGVSTRYWEFAEPDDPRLTIEPDIRIPLRAADYFAGKDPVLEAAISAP